MEVGVNEGICFHNNDPPHEFQVEIRNAKITTMENALSYACKKHRNKKAMGTRQILRESEEVQKNGKVFKKVSVDRTILMTLTMDWSRECVGDCLLDVNVRYDFYSLNG